MSFSLAPAISVSSSSCMVFSLAVKLIKVEFEGLCACNLKRFLIVRDLMRCLI